MDLSMPITPETAYDDAWNFHSRLERPISPSWSTSSTSSGSHSRVDSTESCSTYQDSPFVEIPLETPPGDTDEYFPHVTADDPSIVAVLGVGYVGLHLVKAFSRYYKVIAFDVSDKRLKMVAGELSNFPNITLTSNPTHLIPATHFLIAVPTPLIPYTNKIDTTIIQSALATLSAHIRPGATVVIESSVSVGMTRSLLSKMIQTHHIYAGMSPERVDPGRTTPTYTTIPKIISGLNDLSPGSLSSISTLYAPIFSTLIPVSTPEVAEMTKLYENCQRMICIAYANEMAEACLSLPSPIDPFEVSRAAATKPFGYIPFTPSAGVGGDCIPVNPNYLFCTSGEKGFPLLRQATEIMSARPGMLADRIMEGLLSKRRRDSATSNHSKPSTTRHRHKILVVGVAFKPGQSLTTNSPGVGIIKRLLDSWDAHVTFADPLVSEQVLPYVPKLDESREWTVAHLCTFDAIVVVMKQTGLDFDVLKKLEDDNDDGVMVVRYCA